MSQCKHLNCVQGYRRQGIVICPFAEKLEDHPPESWVDTMLWLIDHGWESIAVCDDCHAVVDNRQFGEPLTEVQHKPQPRRLGN